MAMTALDYEKIRQLLARYNLAIDLGDADGWAACFTDDGVFECTGLPEYSPFSGRFEGIDALKDYATTQYSRAQGRARHWNWNLEIDGDGKEATMRSYLLILTVGERPAPVNATGIYQDRLRKVRGEWRFAERHIAIDSRVEVALSS
jgi:hypothetical protein